MSERPCVSVIIPAFNAGAHINNAVQSVLGQTLADLELIVVDDGSTDHTLAQLAAIDDSRVRVVHTGHGGVACARNRGIDEARGPFITFLDADDMWTTDKLAAQVEKLTSDAAASAVYSWTTFVDEHGQYLFSKAPQYNAGDVYEDLLVTFFLGSGSNVLARREFVESIGRFEQWAQPVEDWEYWLRGARLGTFAVVPRYHVLYRFSTGSASAAVEQYQCAIERVAEREFAVASPALQTRHNECLSNAKQHACLLYLARTTQADAHRRAGSLLRAAIAQHPASVLSMRTIALLGTWLALCFVPRGQVTGAARAVLRCYGRCGWPLISRR